MQRGGRGRGRRGQWPGGRGNPGWQGGQQDFQQQHAGGMMGPGGGGMGPPMMGPWGADPMEAGPPGMMGGGPGMMGPAGAGMMGPVMDAGGMQQQFGFGDAGPPMPKRMRQADSVAGDEQQQQQQQQQQHQQQQRGRLMNVANDYCQNFVDTGLRPQNYLGETLVDDPLDMYPQQKELREAKLVQVAKHTTPAYGIRADLKRLLLSPETFGTKFDVVLIDPPWEEYVRRAPGFVKDQDREAWTWQEIMDLDIKSIADTHSFVFLWCGSEEGLDAGRHCFERWNFRRIEDICWIKTNKRRDTEPDRKYLSAQHQYPHSMLVHTKVVPRKAAD